MLKLINQYHFSLNLLLHNIQCHRKFIVLLGNCKKTYHQKILKAQDPFIPFSQLKIELDNLSNLLENNKVADVKDILAKLVPSYQSNTKIVDHIYEEQLNFKKNL